MAHMNLQILLKSRPAGTPTPENFEAVEAPMPAPGDAGVLRRTLFLSLDPYMRGRMSDAPSYAPPVAVGVLGCDACVNYKTADLRGALADACPSGVDVYFDNVGGPVLAAALRILNRGARIPLCGMISEYNATETQPGPNLRPLLVSRA